MHIRDKGLSYISHLFCIQIFFNNISFNVNRCSSNNLFTAHRKWIWIETQNLLFFKKVAANYQVFWNSKMYCMIWMYCKIWILSTYCSIPSFNVFKLWIWYGITDYILKNYFDKCNVIRRLYLQKWVASNLFFTVCIFAIYTSHHISRYICKETNFTSSLSLIQFPVNLFMFNL